jgi:hypothetical protein
MKEEDLGLMTVQKQFIYSFRSIFLWCPMAKMGVEYKLGFLVIFAAFLIGGTIDCLFTRCGVCDGGLVWVPVNILVYALVAAAIMGYIYLLFYLIDSEKWYGFLVAIVISGVIPLLILLGARKLYHRLRG